MKGPTYISNLECNLLAIPRLACSSARKLMLHPVNGAAVQSETTRCKYSCRHSQRRGLCSSCAVALRKGVAERQGATETFLKSRRHFSMKLLGRYEKRT